MSLRIRKSNQISNILNNSYRKSKMSILDFEISFEKTQMRNYKMLNKNFTKFKPMIFLKFLNLSDRTKSSSMRKFNHIHRNHFFKINIQITQIMVFRISIFDNSELSLYFKFRFSIGKM